MLEERVCVFGYIFGFTSKAQADPCSLALHFLWILVFQDSEIGGFENSRVRVSTDSGIQGFGDSAAQACFRPFAGVLSAVCRRAFGPCANVLL